MILRIILAFGIALVVGILAHQVYGWQTGKVTVSSKQKAYRVVEAILMICVLAMILIGDKSLLAHRGPIAVIYYWTFCLLLAVVAAFLAMFDVREVSKRWAEERKMNIRELLDSRHNGNED